MIDGVFINSSGVKYAEKNKIRDGIKTGTEKNKGAEKTIVNEFVDEVTTSALFQLLLKKTLLGMAE